MDKKTFPEGHFIGMWMGISMAVVTVIAIPICIVTDMLSFIGLGPAIGVAIGVAIGGAVEEKYKKQGLIIPRNEKQKKRARLALLVSFILLSALLVVALIFWKRNS